MSLSDLSMNAEKIDAVTVFKIQGSINSFTFRKFLQDVIKANASGNVILDLEELTMLSSRGVNAFKELNEAAYNSKNKIILLNLPATVRQVMSMAGIRNIFPLAMNEESAMKLALKSK
jgi:anti-anti-sigma factor